MKVYELVPEGDALIFRVSVVKDPAVEANLMKFSEEKPQYFMNEEKRIIYSVAMRPDKLIFRSNVSDTMTPEPAYVYYTKETIEACQQNYFKNNRNATTNINHEDNNVEGVYCFESWIVKDKDKDKASLMGLDVVDGDWIMGFKIDNAEVWNDVKEGKLDGLSIETYMPKKESVNYKMNIKMSEEKKESFFKTLANFFASENEDKDEEKKPEDMAEEMPTPPADAPTTEDAPNLEAENEALKKEVEELKAKIATLEADKVKEDADLETMKVQFEKFRADFEALKNATPKANAVPKTPVVMSVEKPYEQMTNKEKLKYNRENR